MNPKVPIISILVFFLASVVYGKDMQEYLSQTRDLVREGEHEEALERFIWFHNYALEHEPSMYGVRLSFALGYWKELGNVHPPALEAMKEIRDNNTEILRKGDGDFHLFHDVVALNEQLEEDEKTLQLFEYIHENYPKRARRYWSVADDVVFEARRYDLARQYVDDPVRQFRQEVKTSYERNLEFYDDPQMGGEVFKQYNESTLVNESLKLMNLALALDNKEAAREIQQETLELVDEERLRKVLEDHEGEEEKAERDR